MKNRIISIFLTACMLLVMLPVTASAAIGDTFTAKITVGSSEVDCTFKVLTEPDGSNPGTVQIGNGTDAAITQTNAGELNIPASVSNNSKTYNVIAISTEAFNRCYNLTGLIFASNSQLTTIGKNAFFYCSGLTGSLIIPDKVTTIGDSAFDSCSGLNGSLTLPANVTTIGNFAFDNCSKLTGSLTIPVGVTTIGENAFYNCKKLTGGLTIPAGVTTINDGTFGSCSGFTGNLTIPAGVTTIGNSAFYGCSGFTGNLTIPAGVTTIGNQAFDQCSSLTGNLTIPAGVTTIGNQAFDGCSKFTGNLNIPAGVTIINNSAFNDCSGFDGTLTIPAGVTTIGDSAFDGCSGLTGNVTIPAGVTTIGMNVFNGCSALTSITLLSSSAPSVGGGSFESIIDRKYKIFVPHDGTGYNTDNWASIYKIPAYTISGTIKGSDTNAGIPATLQLKDSSSANIGSAVNADSSGAYTVPGIPAGNGYTIHVSCTGYQNGTIPGVDVTDVNVAGKDLILSANASTFTITFNANGGSVTPASAVTGVNGKLASLPVPSRVNHHFDGWFTAASAGTQVTYDTVFAANNTIYAQWTYQGGGNDDAGGSYVPAPAPITDTFTYTPSKLTEMISSNQTIKIDNGLQIIADPEDIPRAEGDTIVVKASEIKSPDSLRAFYIAYPDQQGILKGYSVTFSSENNGQSQQITQLNGEITLKFKLTAEEVKGMDPSTLVVYKKGDNGAVVPLKTTYDWENNILSANTDHLCSFYLMGQKGIPTQRLSGDNRYETAAAISCQGWEKAESVILASGEDFPDALAATTLAGYKDAPVLLTAKDKLTSGTIQEIQRLCPKSIYILGGTGVISKAIEDQLAANYKIQRVFGANRYETAVKLGELVQTEKSSAKFGNAAKTVILTTGLSYPYALAAAPFAGQYALPILFTGKDTLHEKTAEALADWGIQKVILIGEKGVISENVENSIKKLNIRVTRVSGEDRYLTSLAVAQYFETYGTDSLNNSSTSGSAKLYTQAAIATGESYPDALAGAVLAAKEKMPLLLVGKSGVCPEIKEYLKGMQLNKLYVYGGNGAITDDIKNEISLSRNK